MTIIDITGPMETGMWYYEVLYPPIAVEDLPPLDWPHGDGKVYGQKITFGGQSGTHIATGAHVYSGKPDISKLPVERCVTSAGIAQVDAEPLGRITLEAVQSSLKEREVTLGRGDALLIATGWDRYWNQGNYLAESPRLAYELVRWAVDEGFGFLGADIPLYDANWDENFWPELYDSGTLPLAPLVNLTTVPVPVARLVALPLKIRGSCGSPCRAILEIED